MTPHDAAIEIKKIVDSSDLNEADTRHQIIDSTIHDVLCWPRTLTKCEEYVARGYADYVLYDRVEQPILFVEAKKSGYYFNLPATYQSADHTRFERIKTLSTDPQTKAAIEQVQKYCVDMGCEHAAITNGNQWIFFKAFEPGKRWQDLQAFVVERFDYFVDQFTDATKQVGLRCDRRAECAWRFVW